MTKFKTFIAANPTDPRVVRILKMLDGPMSLNSKVGKMVGEVEAA